MGRSNFLARSAFDDAGDQPWSIVSSTWVSSFGTTDGLLVGSICCSSRIDLRCAETRRREEGTHMDRAHPDLML